MERVTGIEPVSQPWEGRVLPLNHTRLLLHSNLKTYFLQYLTIDYSVILRYSQIREQ